MTHPISKAAFVVLVCIAFFIVSTETSWTQYATAPNGYYPVGYTGATFTGTVMERSADTITLTYRHGSKTDTFVGRVDAPCHFPSSKTEITRMNLLTIPMGSVITAFYESKTVKVEGTKLRENRIFGISFREMDGKPVPEQERTVFYCRDLPVPSVFRAFSR